MERKSGRGTRKVWGEKEMFVILIVGMATRLYTSVKRDQMVHAKCCLLYFIPQ